jgi:hypothetical protein
MREQYRAYEILTQEHVKLVEIELDHDPWLASPTELNPYVISR